MRSVCALRPPDAYSAIQSLLLQVLLLPARGHNIQKNTARLLALFLSLKMRLEVLVEHAPSISD